MSNLPVGILEQYAAPKAKDLSKEITILLQKRNAVVVVLDDDPTGGQYAGVPLLTHWEEETIKNELNKGSGLFFILTNSRSMPVSEAILVNKTAGNNLKKAFEQTGKHCILISRSDSTMRGHYPGEVIALAEGMELKQYHTAIIPAFIEAGRFTINDVQYVQEGTQLVPAHQTPFAKDKVFGFSAGNLKQWVSEKTGGKTPESGVASFSIREIQHDKNLTEKLNALPPQSTFIVNAVTQYDLQQFAKSYLESDATVIFRTGPSFVAAMGGIQPGHLLSAQEIVAPGAPFGGLFIIGSYVPKTTSQIEKLLETDVRAIELDVNTLVGENSDTLLNSYLEKIEYLLRQRKDVAVYTSRLLVHGQTPVENLRIGNKISAFLVQLVKQLSITPRFLIAKGGITSHDIAVKGLGISRAVIKGLVLKGVPVWQTGTEALFPNIPFIVFPGNVGDEKTLAELYNKLSAV